VSPQPPFLREFAQDLLKNEDHVSSIELKVAPNYTHDDVKAHLSGILGSEYEVKTQEDQHQAFYQVMASEKWAIFLILGFILIIASFNTVSSLTLLVLEKKSDMHILQSMGAMPATIRKVFLAEGMLITSIGIFAGLILGALICWIQIQFGVIRFPSGGSFIVEIYPLKMEFLDFVLVFLMVGIIGWLASVIPVRVLGKRYFSSFDGKELKN